MKRSQALVGVVEELDESGLIIFLKHTQTKVFCPWAHLSDYESTRHRLSVVGTEIHVCHLQEYDQHNRLLVSHKHLHPEEQHNKNKIVPTATHFQSLQSIFKNSTPTSEFFNASSSVEPEFIDFKTLNNLT